MFIVVGGQGRRALGRSCLDRAQAEDWARQLIAAGITPVTINGVGFGPEGSARSPDGEEAPRVV
jgi:hypothetical protein